MEHRTCSGDSIARHARKEKVKDRRRSRYCGTGGDASMTEQVNLDKLQLDYEQFGPTLSVVHRFRAACRELRAARERPTKEEVGKMIESFNLVIKGLENRYRELFAEVW